MTGISDHLAQFVILENKQSKILSSTFTYKDWKNFDKINFKSEFQSIKWPTNLGLDKLNPDLSFDIFFSKNLHHF